jgi:hypothetical protein
MRFFLDAIFDPEHDAALQRFFERAKENSPEGQRMRGEAIEAAVRAPHCRLGAGRLVYRVKAGSAPTASGARAGVG